MKARLSALLRKLKKAPKKRLFTFIRGERGIRTPGGITLNSFQDCRNRPLCHFSAAKIQFFLKTAQIYF